VAGLFGGYWGQRLTVQSYEEDPDSKLSLERELAALKLRYKSVSGDMEMYRTRHEVDRQALDLIRSEMASQKGNTAGIEEGLRFYQGIMSPEKVDDGLSFRKPELVLADRDAGVSYRFVVQQEARKHDMVRGVLSVTIEGELFGQSVSYVLDEIAVEYLPDYLNLNFRYFQVLEGEMILPEGFTPELITLVASATKPRKIQVQQQFPWELQERFSNVGK